MVQLVWEEDLTKKTLHKEKLCVCEKVYINDTCLYLYFYLWHVYVENNTGNKHVVSIKYFYKRNNR